MRLRLALLVLLAFGFSVLSFAQVPQGQVLGTVSDPTGASIPAATVTLTNDLTGVVNTATTTTSGDYVFPYLNPGTYSVTVTKDGFETAKVAGFLVEEGQKRRIDAQLKVGEARTTIEVSTTAAPVDTDSAAVGTLYNTHEVTDLPLNGREFSELALLAPTVQDMGTTGAVGITAGASFATQLLIGSGQIWYANNYTYDGIDNTFPLISGAALNPSIDSIQEFRIDRSQFEAEYGRGADEIEIVTKTGTNQLHGAAWDYVRNGDFDAGDYYLHQADQLHRNQFGANLGGPIRKDKAFFFFNYEGQRIANIARELGTVFTPLQRQGNLSEFLPQTIVNPFTGVAYPGNKIPPGSLNAVSLSLMNTYMPLPNLPGVVNNYLEPFPETDSWNQYIARVDFNPTSKDHITGRFAGEPRNGLTPGLSEGSVATLVDSDYYNVAAAWTHNWTSNTLTEFRGGYHHEYILQNSIALPAYANPNIAGVGNSEPIIEIFPYGVYMIAWNFPADWHMKSYDWIANVTHIRGAHTIKAGFELENHSWSRPKGPGPEHVVEVFSGVYTNVGVADYMLGIPAAASRPNTFIPTASNQYFGDGYVQDNWKALPNLTINVGLRYDLITRRKEDNNLLSNFDPATGKVVVAGTTINSQFANAAVLTGNPNLYVTAPQPGYPVGTLANGQHLDFSPRFGFAWRPSRSSNKTVVRGGYGMFYMGYWETVEGNGFAGTPYGYGGGSVTNTTPPTLGIQNPFAAGLGAIPIPEAYYWNPNIHDGYMQQANIGVERELPWSMVAEVNFQEQHALHLNSEINLNQPQATANATPNPLPYPYLQTELEGQVNAGHSQYRNMELILRRHTTHTNFEMSYVWGKNLQVLSPEDPYHPNEFYGPSLYVPKQFKLNYVVDIPVGKGRRFVNRGGVADVILGGWESSANLVWSSGGAFTVTTPLDPENVPLPPQGLDGDFSGARPNRVCSGRLSSPTMQQWINTSCFTNPTPGTFGNAGTGILFGPNSWGADWAIFKNFTLHENVKLQYRAEMFNVFNHPNWGGVDAGFLDPTFGQITSMSQSPRQIQMALRLTF